MKRNFASELIGFDGDPIRDGDSTANNAVAAVRDWLARGMPSDAEAKKRLEDGVRETNVLTLGRAAVNALMMRYQDEQSIAGEELVKRYRLAKRIFEDAKAGRATEIDSGELDLIKRLMVKLGYTPQVIGPATEILDEDFQDSQK